MDVLMIGVAMMLAAVAGEGGFEPTELAVPGAAEESTESTETPNTPDLVGSGLGGPGGGRWR